MRQTNKRDGRDGTRWDGIRRDGTRRDRQTDFICT